MSDIVENYFAPNKISTELRLCNISYETASFPLVSAFAAILDVFICLYSFALYSIPLVVVSGLEMSAISGDD